VAGLFVEVLARGLRDAKICTAQLMFILVLVVIWNNSGCDYYYLLARDAIKFGR
jgi:hypothetical protein